MKMTKDIKKDLELYNDPNLPDLERKIFTTLKSLVTGESVEIPHEVVQKKLEKC
jgi:hypothetical protein